MALSPMPRPPEIVFGNFMRGMNNRLDPTLIGLDEAIVAQNVVLRDGNIEGMKDVGTSVATTLNAATLAALSTPTDPVSICYTGARWLDNYTSSVASVTGSLVDRRFYLIDGDRTYVTQSNAPPFTALPGINVPLGILPVMSLSAATSAGALTGFYRWALTAATDDGLESNPFYFDYPGTVMASEQAVFTDIVLANDPRITKVNIWRTKANDPTEIYYFVGSAKVYTSGTTRYAAYTDNALDTTMDVLNSLYWQADVIAPQPGDTVGQYTEDHHVAPTLTVLSDAMHVMGGSGSAGSGIPFGGNEDWAYWGMFDDPDYWPTQNKRRMPGKILAIVSQSGTTFYFTPKGIYKVNGFDDSQLQWDDANTRYGVQIGYGHTVKATPHGIFFLAREGLAHFDGSTVTIISKGKLSASYLQGMGITHAAYFDHYYYLYGSASTVVVDLYDGIEDARFITSTTVVTASQATAWIRPLSATSLGSGLGEVLSYSISAGGSGYSSATLTPDQPLFIHVTAGGSGADSTTTANLSGGGPPTTQATLKPIVVGGAVVAVAVTKPPVGTYTSAPTVAFGGSGTGITAIASIGTQAAATAVMTNQAITFAQPTTYGYGYVGGERVTVGGAGTLAEVQTVVTPVGLRNFGMCADTTNSIIYKIGGIREVLNTGTTAVAYFEKYDVKQGGGWVPLAAYSVALNGIDPVVIGGKVYVFGGREAANLGAATRGDLQVYDPAANTWSTKTALGVNLAYYCAATDGTNLYIYGGVNGSSVENTTLYRYNVASNDWTTLGTSTATTRSCMVYLGGKFYVFGGTQGSNVMINTVSGDTWTTDTTGASLGWQAKEFVRGFTDGTYVYLYGGELRGAGSGVPIGQLATSDIWLYRPGTAPTFASSVGSAFGFGERTRMGFVGGMPAIGGGIATGGTAIGYVFGGTTQERLAQSDFWAMDFGVMPAALQTEALIVNVSGQYGTLRSWGGSTMDLGWTYQTKDISDPDPMRKKTAQKIRLVADNAPTVALVRNGTVDSGSAQTGLSRATPITIPTPIASSQGERIGLQFSASAQVYASKTTNNTGVTINSGRYAIAGSYNLVLTVTNPTVSYTASKSTNNTGSTLTGITGTPGAGPYNLVLTVSSGSDQIPTMTSNTAPSGTASASSELNSNFAAWKAMDNSVPSTWQPSPATPPAWIQYQPAASVAADKYKVIVDSTGVYSFTLKASNTGAFSGEETTLDTKTSVSLGANVENTYTYTNSTSYAYYRLTFTLFAGYLNTWQLSTQANYRYAWDGTDETASAHGWNNTPISIVDAQAGTLAFTPGSAAPTTTPGTYTDSVTITPVTESRYRFAYNTVNETASAHTWNTTQVTIQGGSDTAGTLTFTPDAAAPTTENGTYTDVLTLPGNAGATIYCAGLTLVPEGGP